MSVYDFGDPVIIFGDNFSRVEFLIPETDLENFNLDQDNPDPDLARLLADDLPPDEIVGFGRWRCEVWGGQAGTNPPKAMFVFVREPESLLGRLRRLLWS